MYHKDNVLKLGKKYIYDLWFMASGRQPDMYACTKEILRHYGQNKWTITLIQIMDSSRLD